MLGAQKYTFEELKEQINNQLLNQNTYENIYKSTNNIMRIFDAINETNGNNWTAQILNEEGNPLLNNQEQIIFKEAFQPYLENILSFFGKNENEMIGGENKIINNTNDKISGVNEIYDKIINKIGKVNSTVNDYASKYGVLKLEKESDLNPDFKLVPPPTALAISDGVFGLSTSAGFPIPPNITYTALSKLKIPIRTIIFIVYLTVDIARLAMGIVGPSIARKILSVLMAILELLKGDWKKAILSFIGYYGMMPMLFGQLIKVGITMFRMLSPQIQNNIVYGSLDSAKSLLIGILLSIFQTTAPEEIRLPIIASLEKIAEHKAKMDGTLEEIGLESRPDYLSPSWEDLNNIQAVMSDEVYICSCEFQEFVKAVDKSAIIRIVLELLRIPVSKKMIEYKCGKEPCKDFVTEVVESSKDNIKHNILTKNKIKGGRILHSRKK
jgi:hypothetical protein